MIDELGLEEVNEIWTGAESGFGLGVRRDAVIAVVEFEAAIPTTVCPDSELTANVKIATRIVKKTECIGVFCWKSYEPYGI